MVWIAQIIKIYRLGRRHPSEKGAGRAFLREVSFTHWARLGGSKEGEDEKINLFRLLSPSHQQLQPTILKDGFTFG